MVDVGAKPATRRMAIAEAFVRMRPDTLALLETSALEKGDAFAVARIAAIAASKKTADLVPLAHPLALTHVAVDVEAMPMRARAKRSGRGGREAKSGDSERAYPGVRIEARVETTGKTGVELEALTAAMVGALAIYDMAKKHERGMVIERVQLLLKSGGRSGAYRR